MTLLIALQIGDGLITSEGAGEREKGAASREADGIERKGLVSFQVFRFSLLVTVFDSNLKIADKKSHLS